jgi:hypothetical protein
MNGRELESGAETLRGGKETWNGENEDAIFYPISDPICRVDLILVINKEGVDPNIDGI